MDIDEKDRTPFRLEKSHHVAEAILRIHHKYDIESVIGDDASGVLYRGRHVDDCHAVAIKLFRGSVVPAPVGEQTITDPPADLLGVDSVHRSGSGAFFALMEMPSGTCLDTILTRKGKLSPTVAVNIALRLSAMLSALHRQNAVHGHLNAKNIFLGRRSNGEEVLQLLYHRLAGPPSLFNFFTALSPELATDRDLPAASDDEWAVMVLLYQMLHGIVPFDGAGRDDIVVRILTFEPVISGEIELKHPTLASLLRKGLAKQQDARFRNIDEIHAALDVVSETLWDMSVEFELGEQETTVVSQNIDFDDDEVGSADITVEKVLQIEADALRDTAEILAIRALSLTSSTLPPPPKEPAIVVARRETVDVTRKSVFSDQLACQEKTYVRRSRASKLMAAALAGALLTALAPTFIHWILGDDAARVKRTTEVLPPAPVASEAVSDRARESDMAVSQPDPETVASGISHQENVTITLDGLPVDARVAVDGQPVDIPIVVPKSEVPITIKVFTADRVVLVKTLVPQHSQTIGMKRLSQKTRRSDDVKHQSLENRTDSNAAKANSSGDPGSLSSNPYQLKKNPFATGGRK